MGFVKAQIQDLLQQVVTGDLSFEDYFEMLADDPPSLQLQLRAALDQRLKADWDQIEYRLVVDELQLEWDPDHEVEHGSRAQARGEVFDAFAQRQQSGTLPDGWDYDENGTAVCVNPAAAPKVTGKIEPAKPGKRKRKAKRKGKATDPTRAKGGRFLANVAEVWGYDPKSGLLCRVVFADDPNTNIAKAHALAADIERQWAELGITDTPCAFVKFRRGDMQGNANVILASGRGYIASPDSVVKLHAQAKGQGHSAPIGEKVSKTSKKHIEAMLASNVAYKGTAGASRCVEPVTVEPDDPNEIVYSIRYQSGATREVKALPLSDESDLTTKMVELDRQGERLWATTAKLTIETLRGRRRAIELQQQAADAWSEMGRLYGYLIDDRDDKPVTLAGHRKRAYRLLLESPSVRSDSPASVKYAIHGEDEKVSFHFAKRSEAIEWEESHLHEEEDPRVSELHSRFVDGGVDEDQYFIELARLKQEIDPVYRERKRSPVCFQPRTRVDYNSEGRHVWGGTRGGKRGGKSPGAAWISGQRTFEASIYNM